MERKIVTGIDLVEIGRIAKSMENPRFLERVYSPEELELLRSRAKADTPLHLSLSAVNTAAANFCAKEAFAKAMGTGVRGFSLSEVSVLRDELGRPYLSLSGNAAKLAQCMGHRDAVLLCAAVEPQPPIVAPLPRCPAAPCPRN